MDENHIPYFPLIKIEERNKGVVMRSLVRIHREGGWRVMTHYKRWEITNTAPLSLAIQCFMCECYKSQILHKGITGTDPDDMQISEEERLRREMPQTQSSSLNSNGLS